MVVRLRTTQVVYGPPLPREKGKRGRPRQYGPRFLLNASTTWPDPDGEDTWDETLANGRRVRIHLKVRYNMRMRGSRPSPMYRTPFTLIRVIITTPEGRPLYRCPLWLAFFGPQRQVWAPKLIYAAYRQRFDQEHMHRFLSQHLLATAYETPVTDHEEHGWRIVSLAYCQLWLAHPLARARWRPWEKHLAKKQTSSPVRILSPTHVQRDFQHIWGRLARPPGASNPGKTQGMGARAASQTTTTLQNRSQKPQEGPLAPVLARL